MGVTPAELEANNGKFVGIVVCGQTYEGILHYRPQDGHYSIQIWADSCCFITFIAPEDVEELILNPCATIKSCCPAKCLPDILLMVITSKCKCLSKENYILEWNDAKRKYEFDYPGICNCTTFHSELSCLDDKWVCYLALKNEIGFTCMDGINLNFPIDCSTMKGKSQIEFTKTGTCDCGSCADGVITVKFSPID